MVKNELYHHGILGQKWGKRNGPPYPLGMSDHSASEKTAGWKQSLDSSGTEKHTKSGLGKEDTATDQVAKGKSFVERYSNQKVSQMGKAGGAGEELAIQAIAYTTAIATMYGISKLSEHFSRKGKMKELDEYNKTKDIKSFADAPRLSQKMSAKDSMKLTNPDYPSDGTTMNCTFCTTAMALREKGYDVRARKTRDGFYADDLFKATFNSPEIKMSRRSKPDDVLKTLASNGNGAYGNLTVMWTLGGGHSVFWKNENGRTHIYDGQSGEEITSSASATRNFMSYVNLRNVKYNRLDNCKPTEYALSIVERNDKK